MVEYFGRSIRTDRGKVNVENHKVALGPDATKDFKKRLVTGTVRNNYLGLVMIYLVDRSNFG